MSRADESAFPFKLGQFREKDGSLKVHYEGGLTIREYVAVMAMQGFCANGALRMDEDDIADAAWCTADAFLAERERRMGEPK